MEGDSVPQHPTRKSSVMGMWFRLAPLMAELLRRKVDVIVTTGTTAIRAPKDATSTVPIVVAGGGDPVGAGLVQSLARPGGNVTGVSLQVID